MAVAPEGVFEELRLVVGIVVPVLLQMGLNEFVRSATFAFVGHYDPAPEAIAAAALGNTYGSITGLSVGFGVTMAVGSYCARNYGRRAVVENGVVVRHCLSAHFLCFLFALSAAEASPVLLRACWQPEELLQPVRRFALISACAWPGNWIFLCLSMVLSSQNCQVMGVVGQVLSSTINFVLSWWLLSHGTGFLGIAVANVVAAWASVAYIVIHVLVRGQQSAVWRVPPKMGDAGKVTLGQYVRTALPMAVSVWVEWWALEVLTLFAGWLPGRQISLAAHGILFNTLVVNYMAFVAVSRASMFRVGQMIGARDLPGVRLSIRVCLLVAAALSGAVAGLLQAFGGRLARLFTHDERILGAAQPAMLGVVLSIPPYAVMMCLMGALRSAGLQVWGAKALFASYYAVGLPLGYCLGVVRHGGLLGIWLGNVAALSCAALSCLAKVSVIDWSAVLEAAECSAASNSIGDGTPLLRDGAEHSGVATSCSGDGPVTSQKMV